MSLRPADGEWLASAAAPAALQTTHNLSTVCGRFALSETLGVKERAYQIFPLNVTRFHLLNAGKCANNRNIRAAGIRCLLAGRGCAENYLCMK